MNQLFKINTDLDIPIYRQLVDAICNAIKTGDFPAGHQLPTVFEMTEILGVARGTVKRAYDELEPYIAPCRVITPLRKQDASRLTQSLSIKQF